MLNDNHLLDIASLSIAKISQIIDIAKEFKTGKLKYDLSDKSVVLMFSENSTRTKMSFELAAKNLKIKTLNFECASSSFSKGESLQATAKNLLAMGINAIVVRDKTSGLLNWLSEKLDDKISLINAGDGYHAHPTQALLDYFTMVEKFGTVENKKIAIIGDVIHSRVARSNIELLNKFGADVHVCSPSYFAFQNVNNLKITLHNKLLPAIENADVVMCLRIQKERFENNFYPPVSDYVKEFRVSSKLLNKYAKKDCLLMHPGPVNPDYEMTAELFNSEKAKTIFKQVTNGVYVRMAVLKILLEGEN